MTLIYLVTVENPSIAIAEILSPPKGVDAPMNSKILIPDSCRSEGNSIARSYHHPVDGQSCPSHVVRRCEVNNNRSACSLYSVTIS